MEVEILENEIVDKDNNDDAAANVLLCKGRFDRSRWEIGHNTASIEFPMLWYDYNQCIRADVDIKRGLVRLHEHTELTVVELLIELPILRGRLDTNLLDWSTLKVLVLANRVRVTIEHKNKRVGWMNTVDLYTAGLYADKNAFESAWSSILKIAFDELPINHEERRRELSGVFPFDRDLLDLVVEKEAHLVFQDPARRQKKWSHGACRYALFAIHWRAFNDRATNRGGDATMMLERILRECDLDAEEVTSMVEFGLAHKYSMDRDCYMVNPEVWMACREQNTVVHRSIVERFDLDPGTMDVYHFGYLPLADVPIIDNVLRTRS